MAVIEPQTLEVKEWTGLHLMHYGMSNCSQRVRIMLEEKGLTWNSRIIDIPKEENLTDWYQGINPNGVVPTLVHDGKVIIESTDILEYLDEQFPGSCGSLTNGDGLQHNTLKAMIARANSAQTQIKLLSFEYLFKPMAKKNRKQLATLEQKLRNQELLAFHQRFSSKSGVATGELLNNICVMHEHLHTLEQQLSQNSWLAGNRFSIADIAWIVNIHRLELMHFPLDRYPHLVSWTARMKSRPSYRKALVDYQPPAIGIVRCYAWFRSRFGRASFRHAVC
ncbi:glutathione S-transferase family protein [Pseudomaricurvus alkylphenolicus]|jgi:glutathione S-transferase|uniref:glutathione S-transferase family protein n=1 Tax=Pseudomaricurvus alkylphenolicus TaxID=1306991 RepID=UPI001420E9EC|nr:glutathione S-transferase family protein [Pseudomaricurvus alkylphenolicus]NIB40481.1 glutathione S-transferase family protein [Pseudomaricurvus alkylphenolicus]